MSKYSYEMVTREPSPRF